MSDQPLEDRPSPPSPPTPRQQLEAWASEWSAQWDSRVHVNVLLVAMAAFAFLIWSANAPPHIGVVLVVGTLVAFSLAKRLFSPAPWMLFLVTAVHVIENIQFRIVYDFVFFSDAVAVVALLLLVACMLQQLETSSRGFQRWRLTGRGDQVSVDRGERLERHGNGRIRVNYWSFVRLLIGVAFAWTLLSIWSIEDFSRNRFRFDAPVYRLVVIVWALAMTLLAPLTLLSILRWRRLSAEQAELYLRRAYAEDADAEHRLLERARNKWERTGRA